MNPIIKASLMGLVLAAGLGVHMGSHAQEEASQPAKRTVADVERSLQDLARETEEQRRGLAQRYSDKRRELVESEEWKGLSRVERRARLGALNDEYKEQEERLKDGYKEKREGFVRERQALEDTAEVESSAL